MLEWIFRNPAKLFCFIDASRDPDQIDGMSQGNVVDIERIGRSAAQDAASLAPVELVDVVSDIDFRDRPVYRFAFLVDENIDWKLSGRVRIRLEQKLRDELAALGEVRYPILQMLSRSELSTRAGA